MAGLPTGTVTFLFTDIEGSTLLLQRLGDARYAQVLAEHRRLMRTAIEAGGGHEIETQGDGFLVVFQSARHAIHTALNAQRAMVHHSWPQDAALRVRMGLDTGEAAIHAGAYVGLGLHRAQRICTAGWGGQILLSRTTAEVIASELPAAVGVRTLGEYRLKDLQRSEIICQILHPDLQAEFPPLRSLDSLPNNLPRPLTSFVGREREMAEVRRLLSTTRLLTLTGSGGCGKTRLAIQAGADLVDSFGDGVWWVDLAPLSDASLVSQAVASALHVREEPGGPLLETLSEYLQPKKLLLLLDNCEHLVEATAQLAEALLRACPGLQILATSREPLRIYGETTWLVPSLSLPDPARLPPPGSLADYEAGRLFVERAEAALPGFRVTEHNAPHLARVCQRLDGIPLAIELAATRVKVLSIDQIAARLDDSFRLLTGGSRTALPRQQTLEAAMNWSYALLSEQERMLLGRLSAFAGGWTLEAAEAVCAGDGIETDAVLDLLSQLVDRSLVAVDSEDADVRYRFLDTVRQYARNRLGESGEEAGVRRRHLDWFLGVAERAEPELRGPEQAAWLKWLEADHDNLRNALEWSQAAEIDDRGVRLAGALGRFWWMRGYFTEGRGWLERTLRRHHNAPVAPRARGLLEASRLAWTQSDYPAATALGEGSLALFRELANKLGISDALNILGLVAAAQGDYAAARTRYEEALVLSREFGDKRQVAVLLNNLGLVAVEQGDHAAARPLHEESLAIRRDLGDMHGVSHSLNSLGLVAAAQHDYSRARALLGESLRIRRELGDKRGVSSSLSNLGLLAYREGDYEQATTLWKQSLALRNELGDKRGIAESLDTVAGAASAQGSFARAARLFGAAVALRERIGAPLGPSDRAEYDRNVAAARAALGEQVFATTWAEGRAMTLKQAIECAVSEDGGGDSPAVQVP